MPFVRCPVCEDILNLGPGLALEQPVTCSTCLSNLRVVAVEPPELEEARKRPIKPGRQSYHTSQTNQGRRLEGTGGRPGNLQRDRRFIAPPPPVVPPNPEKQVDGRRAQKWERSKQVPEDDDIEEFEELENKLIRNRGGKGKKGR